jgi:ABC-type amino acid transport substrate-binding protein
MDQWVYEHEDSMWTYVGESGAVYIKLLPDNRYEKTIDNAAGKTIAVIRGTVDELDPAFRQPCTT